MERMAGDLRTLINSRMPFDFTNMPFDYNGPMPFDYVNIITMMLQIAQGMEDLHRCGLIHADLKAANILVTPVILSPTLTYFYVKIGDFETSDGVVGTRFWRAPEVLQAQEKEVKPILSPAADVYSYGMLCYELLTGRIPFQGCGCSNKAQILKILSGQKPELTAHVNQNMKKMLHACWHMDLRQRPGWRWIIETLKEELKLDAAGSHQPKWRAQPGIKMEREKMEAAAMTSEMSSLVVTSWEGAVAQGVKFPHRTERFADWKKKDVPKILPELLPIVKVILKLGKAFTQDTYDIETVDEDTRCYHPEETTFSEVLSTFDDAWYVVQENWRKHVGKGAGRYSPGSIDYWYPNFRWVPMMMGRKIFSPRRKDMKIWAGYAPMRMVRQIRMKNALKPCNLLGLTADGWLTEILATSEEWEIFLTISHIWHSRNERTFQKWKEKLQEVSSAWKEVDISFQAWHLKSATALTALEAVEKKMYSVCREEIKPEVRRKCELEYYNKLVLISLALVDC